MILINSLNHRVENREIEVVERKGLGHPDTLADLIAEDSSARYSRYLSDNFGGRLAHHWFDKVVLLGGESRIDYGVGEILRPYEVLFIGKGVRNVGEHAIPLKEIFFESAQKVCSDILIGFVPDKHLVVKDLISDYQGPGQKQSRYRPKDSEDLIDLRTHHARSNDCNLCISYWPLSLLENVVLNTELHLNSQKFREEWESCTGADIKIVGQRIGKSFSLVVNFPLIAARIHSWEAYEKKISELYDYIFNFIRGNFDLELASLEVNPERTRGRPYLTVLGSVADTGDVGVVGRGNRSNGLISPMRPMSIEAWAGKNPIDHTGKLYTYACNKIAKNIYNRTSLACEVLLTSSKERPASDPDLISVNIYQEKDAFDDFREVINDIVKEELSNLSEISRTAIFGLEPLRL